MRVARARGGASVGWAGGRGRERTMFVPGNRDQWLQSRVRGWPYAGVLNRAGCAVGRTSTAEISLADRRVPAIWRRPIETRSQRDNTKGRGGQLLTQISPDGAAPTPHPRTPARSPALRRVPTSQVPVLCPARPRRSPSPRRPSLQGPWAQFFVLL